MSFGNAFGVDVKVSEEDLFNYSYGSILVECDKPLDFPAAEYLGTVTTGEDGMLHINGTSLSIFELMETCGERFSSIYPSECEPSHKAVVPAGLGNAAPLKKKKSEMKWKGEPVGTPVAYRSPR